MLQVKNTSSGVMLLVINSGSIRDSGVKSDWMLQAENPESIRDSGISHYKNRIRLYLPLRNNLLNQPDLIHAPKLQVKNTSRGTNPPDLIYP
jgi:hypothetical protein